MSEDFYKPVNIRDSIFGDLCIFIFLNRVTIAK
jgi:hypothetical protein